MDQATKVPYLLFTASLSLGWQPLSTMDRYSLAAEFEETLMSRRIESLTEVDDVREVAISLMRHNFALKRQIQLWIKQGWLPSTRTNP